ncbi:MAG: TlpA disulfide reductase family protein [Acidobacteriota bacterium]
MLKGILAFSLCGLFWLAVLPVQRASFFVSAQPRKPSQILKQVAEQQDKLLEKFDSDVGAGKAQLYDWEARADTLRQFIAERTAGFKIADWKGDELLSLAMLYQTAENFPASIEASRAYLKEDSKSRKALETQFNMARALIEIEQFAEAENVLAGMHFARTSFREAPMVVAAKLAVYKELALAWRDQNKLDRALVMAKEGFDLAAATTQDRLNEVARRDHFSLAALYVALLERLNRKKEADDFQKRFVTGDLKEQPPMQSFYEAELASARLTGKPAPELADIRWLSDAPKTIAGLRGKVVLLNFWAMWCSSCAGDFPHLAEFQNKFRGKVEVIGVTRFYGRSDTEEGLSREQELKSLQNFKSKHRMNYPVAVGKIDDLTNDERYGIAGMPSVILIDRSGIVRHIQRSGGEYRKLEKRIEKLANEN